jgi:hypothetical protein
MFLLLVVTPLLDSSCAVQKKVMLTGNNTVTSNARYETVKHVKETEVCLSNSFHRTDTILTS